MVHGDDGLKIRTKRQKELKVQRELTFPRGLQTQGYTIEASYHTWLADALLVQQELGISSPDAGTPVSIV